MIWLLDFSDTLVTGSKTWAFEHAFPALIRENNLPFDPVSFNEITLRAQQKASESQNEAVVLDEMFAALHWPDHLKKELLKRTFELYRPKLFDDTIPFLDKIRHAGQKLFIVSNTSEASELAHEFGIDKYFELILTPKTCGCAGKPDTALWECLLSKWKPMSTFDKQAVTVVGDDPWSDGLFATRIGLNYWIIDRGQRMTSLRKHTTARWVQSLLEIPV
jgi:FMN phosphatase YigB (HAD superfamily)